MWVQVEDPDIHRPINTKQTRPPRPGKPERGGTSHAIGFAASSHSITLFITCTPASRRTAGTWETQG